MKIKRLAGIDRTDLLFNSLRDRRPRRDKISYICDFSRGGLNVRFMRSHLGFEGEGRSFLLALRILWIDMFFDLLQYQLHMESGDAEQCLYETVESIVNGNTIEVIIEELADQK